MKVPEHRKWIDNRVGPDNGRVTNEFMAGIDEFLDFACAQAPFLTLHKLRCPCQKCKCMKYQSADDVRGHLCMKGFMSNYYYWTNHNESRPPFPPVVINDSYYGSEDEANVEKIFNSRGSGSLRNTMSKAHTNEDKGDWIQLDKLKELEDKWQTDDGKEKSRKAKQNRHGKEGHNAHSGESISAREHAKRMKVQLNREPTCLELYERLHRPKGKLNEWLNKEQENIVETCQNRVVETQFEDGESSSSESINSIFLEVVGGVSKKRRIFEMGSHAVGGRESFSTLSTPMNGVSSEEVAQMKSTIQTLADELERQNIEQEKMKKKMEEWKLKFERLMLHKNATSSLVSIQEENNNDNGMGEGEHDREH